jgi:hypothetical protein
MYWDPTKPTPTAIRITTAKTAISNSMSMSHTLS